jgi:hypothetical protein
MGTVGAMPARLSSRQFPRTRNELETPLFDDTALNTIVIYCNDELATNFTSTPGL